MKKLSKMLKSSSNKSSSQSQTEHKPKKSTPKKSLGAVKSKSIPSDESKAGIEEIKKKLAGRIDFSNTESTLNQPSIAKKPERPKEQGKFLILNFSQ